MFLRIICASVHAKLYWFITISVGLYAALHSMHYFAQLGTFHVAAS